jgi:hypothetical protein
VRSLLIICGLMDLIAGGLGLYLPSGGLLVIAIAMIGLICFVIAMTVRCRTVIGLDGIRDRRPLSAEIFIPWTDVKEIIVAAAGGRRLVTVARHSGSSDRRLSAIREGDVASDGLGFDELVAVIRQRARQRPAPGHLR